MDVHLKIYLSTKIKTKKKKCILHLRFLATYRKQTCLFVCLFVFFSLKEKQTHKIETACSVSHNAMWATTEIPIKNVSNTNKLYI